MCPQHHKRADSMMLGCDARVGGMISVLATSAPGPRRRQKPRERPPPRSAAQPHDRRHLVALGTVTTSDVLGRSGRSGCNAPSPRFCVAPRPITARRAIGSCPAPNSVSRSRSAAAIYLSAHGTRTRGARDGSIHGLWHGLRECGGDLGDIWRVIGPPRGFWRALLN